MVGHVNLRRCLVQSFRHICLGPSYSLPVSFMAILVVSILFFFLIRQVNESLLYSLIQCKHLFRSSRFPAPTVPRSGCSKPDKFGQRAISLSFFFQIPFSPLDGLLEVQHRFYRVLLWSGYRIEQSLYNIHYLCAVNDRMQVLWIPYSAYMAMFQYCTHIQIIISMGIYKHT